MRIGKITGPGDVNSLGAFSRLSRIAVEEEQDPAQGRAGHGGLKKRLAAVFKKAADQAAYKAEEEAGIGVNGMLVIVEADVPFEKWEAVKSLARLLNECSEEGDSLDGEILRLNRANVEDVIRQLQAHLSVLRPDGSLDMLACLESCSGDFFCVRMVVHGWHSLCPCADILHNDSSANIGARRSCFGVAPLEKCARAFSAAYPSR